MGKAKEHWAKFKWNDAAQKYRQRIKSLHSTARLLGKPEPVSLQGVFTDVYLLDKPTAFLRFDIEQLKKIHEEQQPVDKVKRVSALRFASQQDRLFILGKPGAGKTTFLKYLTLQAAEGKLDSVPIFVSLNEWANSSLELILFIEQQFEICAFPDARAFIEYLLNQGKALVCFDGLDEVNEAADQRSNITRAIVNFTSQYPENKYLITCRVAATDYTFEKFKYVEIADFTPKQVQSFAQKWFSREPDKAKRFLSELNREEHRGLRELAQTPLLLILLCLNFEETLTFPPRRTEIYEEAIDALLKKWDASRNIKRDEIYRVLSLGRKRQMFARVAAEYFEVGEIFFSLTDLAQRVTDFIKKLPSTDSSDEPEGEIVVKAIAAQHGLFIERAHLIYSFSHLTLQEYFTARYIVDNAADGALERLIDNHLTDKRWHEVFLLTASMLSDADAFMGYIKRAVENIIATDGHLLNFGKWADEKAKVDYRQIDHPVIARAMVIDLARRRAVEVFFAKGMDVHKVMGSGPVLTADLAQAFLREFNFDSDLDFNLSMALDIAQIAAPSKDRPLPAGIIHTLIADPIDKSLKIGKEIGALDLTKALEYLSLPSSESSVTEWGEFASVLEKIVIQYRNTGRDWKFTKEQETRLTKYEIATVLLAECLQLAAVTNREEIANSLLLPPTPKNEGAST